MTYFAIVKLAIVLDLKRFEHEDDWKNAMAELNRRGIDFIALKYHHGAATWQQVEVVR